MFMHLLEMELLEITPMNTLGSEEHLDVEFVMEQTESQELYLALLPLISEMV